MCDRPVFKKIIDFEEAKHISKSDFEKIYKRSDVEYGDIIMPMIGTIGNPVIVQTHRKFAIKNVALFKTSGDLITAKYIFYQFGDRLRNYVAHNAFAITSSSYDPLREQFCGVINPCELLNRDKWTGKVKDWLQQNEKKSKGIDAYSFAIEFYKVCNELQCELWLSKLKQVRSDLLFISNLFPDGYYNIYNICLASQGQAVNVGIGQIIVHFLLKAVQFYPDFVPEYIMGKF